MNTEKSIDVLNTLIEINTNRFESYETAAKETDESDLITLFLEFQQKSQKCKEELIEEVKKLGGIPAYDIKLSKKLFRFWKDIKAAFVNKNREDLLNCCEYDEDLAINAYRSLLKENRENLTLTQQHLLLTQQQLIKMDHDILKKLGDLLLKRKQLN